MAKYTLDQWIRDVLTDEDKDGKCTSISLVHFRNGTQEQEVHTVKLGSRQWDPKQLADMFRGKAESYAEELPGAQTFNLLAFYANRGEPQNRKPLLITGFTQMEGLATEAPTGSGLTQQAMRHLEVQTQTYTRQQHILFEASARSIDALTQMNMRLLKENQDSFQLIRDMLMQQADRRHEHGMEQLRFQRATEERGKLMSAAPALINSLTGRDIFPQNTADSALIEMLIGSLMEGGDDKLGIIAQLGLPPQVMGALAARIQKSLKERALAEHARSSNGADPEDDASGGLQ